jgi:plastocyanin
MVSPMRRPSQVFAAVAACGVIVAAAAFITLAPPSTALETQVCNPQPGQAPADAKVILQDLQYQPSGVDLPAANMSVCWEHDDGQTPHSITFDGSATVKNPPDSNPTCNTPEEPASVKPENCFRQGQIAYKVVFASAGTFTYHCRVHAAMKGVVKVAGGGAPVRTTTTRPATTATTKAASTATTVGTLSETTTTAAVTTTTTSSASTTSSSIALSTTTTASGAAAAKKSDDDDPSGVLEGVGVLLLAAVVIALIPSWRRLT